MKNFTNPGLDQSGFEEPGTEFYRTQDIAQAHNELTAAYLLPAFLEQLLDEAALSRLQIHVAELVLGDFFLRLL